ncbi:hypothetical protein OE810_10235 [Rhodobacteraceae bacterium XHP0102]|nr:hypothetical protein [Rhodobacteraceae bacterium XHP0102]
MAARHIPQDLRQAKHNGTYDGSDMTLTMGARLDLTYGDDIRVNRTHMLVEKQAGFLPL